jgi:hypothetical protein
MDGSAYRATCAALGADLTLRRVTAGARFQTPRDAP